MSELKSSVAEKLKNIFTPNKKKIKSTTKQKTIDMNWKRDIKTEPTYEDFNNAWREIFGYRFEDCSVVGIENGENTGFSVATPKGMHCHGGFGEHTENPQLDSFDEIYYSGCGCTWDTDLNGVRYHKLDKNTGMPVMYKEACDCEIVRRYIINNKQSLSLTQKKKNILC